MSEMKDPRFTHISQDPRFRSVPKNERKVKIDKRFSSMFHKKSFKQNYTMDKRGMPIIKSTTGDLKKYYNLSSDEEKDEKKSGDTEEETSDSEEHVKKNDRSNGIGLDLARGEGNVTSSSSEDEEEEDNEIDQIDHCWGQLDEDVEKNESTSRRLALCNMDWDRIKAKDIFVMAHSFKPPEGFICSVKIYPSEYGVERMKEEESKGPTELVQETLDSDQEDYAETTKEGSQYHMEKLRKYQLNRLKYYYAVIECDSAETATKLYSELDGMEYESSASQLDLRFVPDEMEFEREPTTSCDTPPDLTTYQPLLFTTTALQQATVRLTWDETDADRTQAMKKAFQSAERTASDLQAYLASSSEGEEINEPAFKEESEDVTKKEPKQKSSVQDQIAKYKSLLGILEEEENTKNNKDVELEITWEPGLKDKAEKMVKKKEKKEDMTVFDQYLEEKKDKKRNKRKAVDVSEKEEQEYDTDGSREAFSDDELPAGIDLSDPFFSEEMSLKGPTKTKKKKKDKGYKLSKNAEKFDNQNELQLLTMGEDEDRGRHYHLKDLLVEGEKLSKTKRKKLKMRQKEMAKQQSQEGDTFQLNVSDPRFSAIFSSASFNIDPSDPHYKKTKAMDALLNEKLARSGKKLTLEEETESVALESRKREAELSFLVNSVKNKSRNFNTKKKNKFL